MPAFTSIYSPVWATVPYRSVAVGGLFRSMFILQFVGNFRREEDWEGGEGSVDVCVCVCVYIYLHCLCLVIFGSLCLLRNWPILSILMHL